MRKVKITFLSIETHLWGISIFFDVNNTMIAVWVEENEKDGSWCIDTRTDEQLAILDKKVAAKVIAFADNFIKMLNEVNTEVSC